MLPSRLQETVTYSWVAKGPVIEASSPSAEHLCAWEEAFNKFMGGRQFDFGRLCVWEGVFNRAMGGGQFGTACFGYVRYTPMERTTCRHANEITKGTHTRVVYCAAHPRASSLWQPWTSS